MKCENCDQLQKVFDNGNDTRGFKDGNTGSDDYDYDLNGNLIQDLNKGITNISYNHMNLPTQVTFSTGNIQYVCDATGVKLRKTVNGINTDYAEGRALRKGPVNHFSKGASPARGQIAYTDANQNIGAIDLQIVEENNYYPFGLKHKGYNGTVNGREHPYGFQDQEETNDPFGFNMIEFKYRMHDPAIGRFWQVDPLAAEYVYNGTYNFAENRVIDGNELEGLEWERFAMGVSQVISGLSMHYNNATYGEAHRQIASSKTSDGVKKEQIKHEGQSNRITAMKDISEGGIEAFKGGAKIVGEGLENIGDGASLLAYSTGQVEFLPLTEGISMTGEFINASVDLSDGKSPTIVGIELLFSYSLGEVGEAGVAATRKVAGKEYVKSGANKISEAIIKGSEALNQEYFETKIAPSISLPWEDPNKN